MMKKIIVPELVVFLFFVSCTGFFTTSWGEWAARDPASLIPKITVSNVGELISMSENNPDLSLEVLKKIGNAAGSASGTDKTKLQNAAITAAVNASNLTTTLLANASNVSTLEDAEDVKDLITNTLNSMGNLTPASDALTGILPDPAVDSSGFDAFTDSASADDLALAAALILAGEAKKSVNSEDFIANYTPGSPANAPLILAEELAGKAKEKYDAGANADSPLKDLLDKLGLVPPLSP
jgi:hypothetical protein